MIASPPLVSGQYDGVTWWDEAFVQQEYQKCLPALKALDNDPQPLEKHLAAIKSKALGHRFEGLVSFWLIISPSFELVDQNIQIQGEGRTLGELDFILRDVCSGLLIHLEVSVKFYMGLKDLSNPMNWYGSNLSDSFGRKIDHLKQHQTQLSLLHPDKINYAIDVRCCCVKGRLFYPDDTIPAVSDINLPASPPAAVTSDHLRGVWGYDLSGYLERVYPSGDTEQLTLRKHDWLSEFNTEDPQIQAHRLSIAHPSENPRPLCFALLRQGKEVVRYFQFPPGYFDSVL